MDTIIAPPATMTTEEFLAWEPGDTQKWQLIQGVPEPMAPATDVHALIQAELAIQIGLHLRTLDRNCALAITPGVIPRLYAGHNFRVPDLAVTCTQSPHINPALADPILLIEILSPSNASTTMLNVFAYATIPSVHDILVVDSQSVRAEISTRLSDGIWPAAPTIVTKGRLTLPSIGFETDFASVYRFTPLAA